MFADHFLSITKILEPTKIPTAVIINIGIKYWSSSFSTTYDNTQIIKMIFY